MMVSFSLPSHILTLIGDENGLVSLYTDPGPQIYRHDDLPAKFPWREWKGYTSNFDTTPCFCFSRLCLCKVVGLEGVCCYIRRALLPEQLKKFQSSTFHTTMHWSLMTVSHVSKIYGTFFQPWRTSFVSAKACQMSESDYTSLQLTHWYITGCTGYHSRSASSALVWHGKKRTLMWCKGRPLEALLQSCISTHVCLYYKGGRGRGWCIFLVLQQKKLMKHIWITDPMCLLFILTPTRFSGVTHFASIAYCVHNTH